MKDLGHFPGGAESHAYAINSLDEVVGSATGLFGGRVARRAFVWLLGHSSAGHWLGEFRETRLLL
jgi:hypothetical protein